MPGVTLCDGGGGCLKCDITHIKIHVGLQILGSVNCKKVLPTRLLLVVTNRNHPFSTVFEPQPFGSPA